jgi:hypothetical protein
MPTGDESLEDLYAKETELKVQIEGLHGSERREKETHLQDIRSAIGKLKAKRKKDDVNY